ncbi:MAG: bifunctional aspartate kinase/homoserine dehydrogenase I [Acidobacteria bacterium]|nr:MAG: bifunctional aspartate kinase/homoserine dehydrogenase I [Acidobacteriota bacterium]
MMKVLKFGGTSLESPERIRAVIDIVGDQEPTKLVVVVSAMSGVTDALTDAARVAVSSMSGMSGDATYRGTCTSIEARHRAAVNELGDPAEAPALISRIERRIEELSDLLHGVALVRECSPRSLDQISSYGERLSADLVAAALRKRGIDAEYADARGFIVTDTNFGNARVELEATERGIRNHFDNHKALQVVTGFLGASVDGETTTLGRGGSDYTAALLGSALGADRIEIWTDVNGVMSADPRLVANAFSLEELSYEELMELSHFGAKVVYPPAIHPARAQRIPLVIRNTLEPSFIGTHVNERAAPSENPVRGIASIHDIALLRLEGDGMMGVPGTARRLFEALARENINIILITQASSEHSICFAVAPDDVAKAGRSVDNEFTLEQRAGLVDPLIIERDLSIVAAVGEGMRERRGIAGRLFSVLGSEGVNVRAIAQGSSELNISLVIARDDEKKALNAIHEALLGEPRRAVIHLFVLGIGGVGSELLSQLSAQCETLRAKGLELRLSGVAARRTMRLSRQGLDFSQGKSLLEDGSANDLDELARFIEATPGPRILVDVTASPDVSKLYERLLTQGVAVVTANKLPLAGPMKDFERLHRHARLYYETTAGAGLPVVRTLAGLVDTGDTIERIEGVFSGTLSYLFNRIREGVPPAAALQEARDKGYTEPDPREDLSGMDVVRKLLILARTAGIAIEPEEVSVESLVPEGEIDRFGDTVADAQDRAPEGATLCYLAKLENGRASVGLEAVEPSHPAASLEATDNLFAITTARYHETPLVIRGSGAGPTVTAAGVFADILQACAELESR